MAVKEKRDRRTEINVFSNIANHYEPTARVLQDHGCRAINIWAGTPRNPFPSRRRQRLQSKGAGNQWRKGFTNTRAAGGGIKDIWQRGDLVNTLNEHLSLSVISLLSRADFLTSLGARVSRPKSPVKTVFLYSKFWLIFPKFCFFPIFINWNYGIFTQALDRKHCVDRIYDATYHPTHRSVF